MVEKNVVKIYDLKRVRNLRAKYYVVVIADEENLKICRYCCVLGFPESPRGQWSFLDLNRGDYISLKYKNALYDLYRVHEKYVPRRWRHKDAVGKELLDPEPVCDLNNRVLYWRSLGEKKKRYFPFRIKLELVASKIVNTKQVFEEHCERTGVNNIIIRRKSHLQLPVTDLKKISNKCKQSVSIEKFSFRDFLICRQRYNASRRVAVSRLSISDIIENHELYLQAFIKKVLEGYWGVFKKLFRIESQNIEFLSEQQMSGGNPDILLLGGCGRIEAIIEIKNGSLLNNSTLSKLGQRAMVQLLGYDCSELRRSEPVKILIGCTDTYGKDILAKVVMINGIYVLQLNKLFTFAKFMDEEIIKD